MVDLSKLRIKGRLFKNIPLREFTSFRIGGPADNAIIPKDVEDIKIILSYLNGKNIPYLILAGGTNILIMDEGVREVVIKLPSNLNEIEMIDDERIYVEAQVRIDRLLKFSIDRSLSGIEFLSGIPGRFGGAIRMNAGTYGGDIGSVVESIKIVDREGKVNTIYKKDFRFIYRELFINEGEVIIGGIIKLNKGNKEDIVRKIKEIRDYRKKTQPLSYPSAGSIFKNSSGLKAGKLIEEVGLKGFQIGMAKVSDIHANFIINLGGAKADEVIRIMKFIQRRVYEYKGINLIPEIKIWGGNPLE
jgi:UDP-N-acetylmuramate dehydrogenase